MFLEAIFYFQNPSRDALSIVNYLQRCYQGRIIGPDRHWIWKLLRDLSDAINVKFSLLFADIFAN